MAWLKKKSDPLADRARAINDEIAALESQIKKLGSKGASAGPKLRSTMLPSGATIPQPAEPVPAPPPAPVVREPVFEEINQQQVQSPETRPPPEMFNEFGGRKYDLPALWNRIRNYLRGPTTANPRLVSYLAAGGLNGLRPIRYEKRVARRRFFALVTVLFIVLFLIAYHYYRNR